MHMHRQLELARPAQPAGDGAGMSQSPPKKRKGALQLKGGVPWKAPKSKKAKKDKPEGAVDSITTRDGKQVDFTSISAQTNTTYEAAFDLQMGRAHEGKTRSTPWGSSYRQAPEILHGYTEKVEGKTASERLDLRSSQKADKFCK